MMHQEFLGEIEAFLADSHMSPTRFGKLALNDGEFVRRLRRGSAVTTRTIDRVRSFIDDRKKRAKQPHAAA